MQCLIYMYLMKRITQIVKTLLTEQKYMYMYIAEINTVLPTR